jgi:hypothetical protein
MKKEFLLAGDTPIEEKKEQLINNVNSIGYDIIPVEQHVVNFLKHYIPKNKDSVLSLQFFNYYFNVPGENQKDIFVLYSKYGHDYNEVKEKIRSES